MHSNPQIAAPLRNALEWWVSGQQIARQATPDPKRILTSASRYLDEVFAANYRRGFRVHGLAIVHGSYEQLGICAAIHILSNKMEEHKHRERA